MPKLLPIWLANDKVLEIEVMYSNVKQLIDLYRACVHNQVVEVHQNSITH
jgi:hypothetical protein